MFGTDTVSYNGAQVIEQSSEAVHRTALGYNMQFKALGHFVTVAQLFHPQGDLDYSPVQIHGDLWYENLIIDEGCERLVGVVDFE